MSPLQNLLSTIESLDYPPSRDAFEAWKRSLLSGLQTAAAGPALQVAANDGAPARKTTLSPREDEVMRLLLEGRRLKEIGVRLDISVKTVTTHRARLLRKLGLEDNLGLYRFGIRSGLIAV